MSGKTPAQVLELALRTSAFAFAGLINGDVVTIFGVAPRSMITGSGVPWLVGSDLLERYQPLSSAGAGQFCVFSCSIIRSWKTTSTHATPRLNAGCTGWVSPSMKRSPLAVPGFHSTDLR